MDYHTVTHINGYRGANGHSIFALNITVPSLTDILLVWSCCDVACDGHAELQESDCRREKRSINYRFP